MGIYSDDRSVILPGRGKSLTLEPHHAVSAVVLFLLTLVPVPAAGVSSKRDPDIVRRSSPKFYVDTGINPKLDCNYVAYRVTNNWGQDYADLFVKIGNFQAGSTVGLAPGENGVFHLGPLVQGAAKMVFFYLQATGPNATPKTHDITVHADAPNGTLVDTESFSLTVEETIKANANKVTSVVTGPDPPELGGVVTVTITGQTGTIGNDAGQKVFAATPASMTTWKPDAYELLTSEIVLSGGNTGTFTDRLFLDEQDLPGSANTDYTATYQFRAIGTTATPTAVSPVNYISSGTQIKHTSTDTAEYQALSPIQPADNKLTLAVSSNPVALVGGGTVAMTLTVTNAGNQSATVDDFVHTLPTSPAAASYVANSAKFDDAPFEEPEIAGSVLTWRAQFQIPAGASKSLTFDVSFPATQGTYTSSSVAHVEGTQIDATLDTTNDSPATSTVTVDDTIVAVQATDPAAAEAGADTGTITVTRTGNTSGALIVNFTVSGTATETADYAAIGTSVTIPDGQSLATITVAPVDDVAVEGAETVIVTVAAGDYAIGSPNAATVTIADDDAAAVEVIVAATDANAAEAGADTGTITVTRSTTSGNLTVNFTVSGTANEGADYAAIGTSVQIPDGQTQATVTITPIDDGISEGPETVIVTLSSGAYTIGTPSGATVTIADNDSVGITVSPTVGLTTTEAGGTATFTIVLTSQPTANVTIPLSSSDAGEGTVSPSSVTFTPGDWSTPKTVTVTGVPDALIDGSVAYTIQTGAATSSDLSYHGVNPDDVSVTNDDTTTDLSITAIVDPSPVAEGGTLNYTLEVKNLGPNSAVGAQVEAPLPEGVSFVSANPSQGAYDPATGLWTIGAVPNGQSATLSLSAAVKAGTAGSSITLEAAAGSGQSFDHVAENNTAGATAQVAIPDLAIEFTGAATGVPGPDPLPVVLPNGTEGSFYLQQPFTSGGIGQKSWSVAAASPSFPFDLDPATGEIGGLAPAGTYSFTLQVQDAQTPAAVDVRDFAVTIASSGGTLAVVETPAPATGKVGHVYQRTFTAVGGTGPYSWDITVGGLPTGLFLDPSTGKVAGTPTAAGSFPFTLRVTDLMGAVDTAGFTIQVVPDPVAIETSTLAAGEVGHAYRQSVESTGGIGPTYSWNVISGTQPPGLGLSGSGSIVKLDGTPTTSGTFVFTVEVSDDGQTNVTDTREFTVLISEPGTAKIAITTCCLPKGTSGRPYATPLTAIGDVPANVWSLLSGALPSGLVLDEAAGTLSGTPTESGVFQIVVRIVDSTGATATRELTLEIGAALGIAPPSPLPAAVRNAGYLARLAPIGGIGPFSWIVLAPGGGETGLPAGLTLHPGSGAIGGTATAAAGSYLFTIQLTDANGATAGRQYALDVLEDPAFVTGPSVLTTQLPAGQAGSAYSVFLVAAGGTPGYVWSIEAGSLPAWAIFDPATGTIRGTPDVPGTVALQFRVTDTAAAFSLSVVMNLVVLDAVRILTTGLPSAPKGGSYDQTLQGSGGTPGYLWTILQGSLPPGLSLDATLGRISGVASQSGTFKLLVRVTDVEGRTSERLLVLEVILAVPGDPSERDLAGYCAVQPVASRGSEHFLLLGFAGLLLLAFLVRYRRAGFSQGSAWTVLLLLSAAGSAAAREVSLGDPLSPTVLPAVFQEEEPPAVVERRIEEKPFIDYAHPEAEIFLGAAFYSSDFEADAGFVAGLLLRVRVPGISEKLGLFARFSGSGIERDIAESDGGTGVDFVLGIGLDYAFHEDEDVAFRAGAGIAYGWFHDVPRTDDGFGIEANVAGAVRIVSNLWLTLRVELIAAAVDSDGDERDFTVLGSLGLLVRF